MDGDVITIPIGTATVVQGLFGLLLVIVGWLIKRVLDRLDDRIGRVETQTSNIPGLVVQVDVLGREMGERKAWEQGHTAFHLKANGQPSSGD